MHSHTVPSTPPVYVSVTSLPWCPTNLKLGEIMASEAETIIAGFINQLCDEATKGPAGVFLYNTYSDLNWHNNQAKEIFQKVVDLCERKIADGSFFNTDTCIKSVVKRTIDSEKARCLLQHPTLSKRLTKQQEEDARLKLASFEQFASSHSEPQISTKREKEKIMNFQLFTANGICYIQYPGQQPMIIDAMQYNNLMQQQMQAGMMNGMMPGMMNNNMMAGMMTPQQQLMMATQQMQNGMMTGMPTNGMMIMNQPAPVVSPMQQNVAIDTPSVNGAAGNNLRFGNQADADFLLAPATAIANVKPLFGSDDEIASIPSQTAIRQAANQAAVMFNDNNPDDTQPQDFNVTQNQQQAAVVSTTEPTYGFVSPLEQRTNTRLINGLEIPIGSRGQRYRAAADLLARVTDPLEELSQWSDAFHPELIMVTSRDEAFRLTQDIEVPKESIVYRAAGILVNYITINQDPTAIVAALTDDKPEATKFAKNLCGFLDVCLKAAREDDFNDGMRLCLWLDNWLTDSINEYLTKVIGFDGSITSFMEDIQGIVTIIEEEYGGVNGTVFQQFIRYVNSLLNEFYLSLSSPQAELAKGFIEDRMEIEGKEKKKGSQRAFLLEGFTVTYLNQLSPELGLNVIRKGETAVLSTEEMATLARIMDSSVNVDFEFPNVNKYLVTADGMRFVVHYEANCSAKKMSLTRV